MPIRALLVEDNPGDARLIIEMLRDAAAGGVDIVHTDRLASGLQLLNERGADVLLLDLSLPDSQGLPTFEAAHAAVPSVPIVVLSGLDSEEVALQAMQHGAQDYLVKGQAEGGMIVRSLRYAIERQRLETARANLEQQRDEFFSSISHDLRTPVAAIKAAISVVLANEPADMPPALHRLLGNVDLAADELTRLIDDLLQMARLQAGRVELHLTDVDVRDVVTRAVRSVEPLIQARGQRLELRLPSEAVTAQIDPERFGRVIRNLVGNAQKYAGADGTITVVMEATPGELMVAIGDDGPGIPVAEQERIFDRFYRAPRAGAEGPIGTGLGLPIARGLVELHGGRLTLQSAPGAGSVFTAHVPLAAT